LSERTISEKQRNRFNSKWMPEPYSGCWIWTGDIHADGYGLIKCNGRRLFAHRHSWRLHHGEIPPGMCILHKCDTPACVNPKHLFYGSRTDNITDCVNKGRNSKGERKGSAKLTPAAIREIRALDSPQSLIAERYGVTQATVSMIKNKITWRHIA
jgi:hypothetical protein